MSKWISVENQLPIGGQEVLTYHGFGGDGNIDILTYFEKGNVMDYDLNFNIQNPALRFLDSLLNKSNEIIANENGFYIYDNVTGECAWRKHSDVITHWMPLPEFPEKEDGENV